MTCEFPRWEVTGQRNRAQRRFEALSPSPQPSPSGRESSGLCARIAPRNLTRALLAGLDHKRMPALISNDLRVSKMGGYWAGRLVAGQSAVAVAVRRGSAMRSVRGAAPFLLVPEGKGRPAQPAFHDRFVTFRRGWKQVGFLRTPPAYLRVDLPKGPHAYCEALPSIVAAKDDYLLDNLIELGYLTSDQVEEVRGEAAAGGTGVVDLLLERKVITSAILTQAKAAHFGMEVVNLAEVRLEDEVISSVPRHVAKRYRVVPIFKHGNHLAVALSDPSELGT